MGRLVEGLLEIKANIDREKVNEASIRIITVRVNIR